MGRFGEHARARKTGHGKDDRVAVTFAKLAKAGFDVAAQRDELEIGALALKLHDATP